MLKELQNSSSQITDCRCRRCLGVVGDCLITALYQFDGDSWEGNFNHKIV